MDDSQGTRVVRIVSSIITAVVIVVDDDARMAIVA